ncbi:hypothetical protein GCM10023196_035350 [Actinoallomurus vinaceus]|uniref:Uncharacterized protein n=1 Tax=Actinoallomurus vinaceus TaxID=1080074 RepID=A0ABP8U8T2_9ACTN
MTTMTLAKRLVYTGRQLEVLEQAARTEAKPSDLAALAEHLRELGDRGRQIQVVIDRLFEYTGPEHNDAQLYLAHAGNLFEAAQTYAGIAFAQLRDTSAAPS